ncbi:MAG: hypothetical protein NT091_03350 [Candidatus Falkowbacteria bacterium]|nr:hypothetical protein [Candidatus Falkowbacteria bacterium]
MLLDKKQKMALTGLSIFAIFVVVMWYQNLKTTINSPYVYNGPDVPDTITPPSVEGDLLGYNLANKDTDKDGLTDQDELNVYHTSPYLPDTDGDGVNDGDEVSAGTDPNCGGSNCFKSGLYVATGLGDTASSTVDTSGANTAGVGASGTAAPSKEVIVTQMIQDASLDASKVDKSSIDTGAMLSGKSDAKSLRAVMMQAGMDPKILNSISDDVLMKTYAQTLKGK